MKQSADSLTVSKLEDDIGIWSWGQWARDGLPARSYPGWVVLMMQGYRENRYRQFPEITDDHALLIDGLVSRLPEQPRAVVYSIYVCSKSINDLARLQRRSRSAIAQDRDFALATIWGAMGGLSEHRARA